MLRWFGFLQIFAFLASGWAQQGFYFTQLRGLEDAGGNTHLFYRMYFERTNPHYLSHHVYHWDLLQNTDSLFLADFQEEEFHVEAVADYEFWFNDPARYIAGGSISDLDPAPVIWLPDTDFVMVRGCCGHIANIELSRQDAQKVYADNAGNLMISTNGGRRWEYVGDSTAYGPQLLAASPFDDRVLFALQGLVNTEDLVKSTDGGESFYPVARSFNLLTRGGELFFASDTQHIWGLSENATALWASEDAGETWQILRQDSLRMRVAIDTGPGNALYLSRGNEILRSDDFGQTFAPVATLTRDIIDLYKKPHTEILYAATKFTIYEITAKDTVAIKSLPVVGISSEPLRKPQQMELYQNYPNPFNPVTTIAFYLPAPRQVTLEVYTVSGERIARLVQGRLAAGRHEVQFSGKNLPSGLYFYQLKTGEAIRRSRQMILLK